MEGTSKESVSVVICSVFLRVLCARGKITGIFPVNMPDPIQSEAFWLRPVVAIGASVQPESGRIVYVVSDFRHPIRFRSSREGPDHIEQNRPGSDVDGLVTVLANVFGPEASRCARVMGLTEHTPSIALRHLPPNSARFR